MTRETDISQQFLNLLADRIDKELSALLRWPARYGWIKEENIKLTKELKRIEENSPFYVPKVEFYDPRNLKPYPETTTQEIGWASSRKEFNLEIYGANYEKILKNYRINKIVSYSFQIHLKIDIKRSKYV